MNDQTPPAPQGDLTLTVSFDIDQDGSHLLYSFFPEGTTPDPTKEGGHYAGAIYFPLDEQIKLVVQGWGNKTTFDTFTILDCSFVTRPKIIEMSGDITMYAPPSPFKGINGPIYQIPPKFGPPDHTLDETEMCKSYKLLDPILIGKAPGRWEISFFLTTRIERVAPSTPEVRVFWFDPEGEVGTGAVIREDDVDANRVQSSTQ